MIDGAAVYCSKRYSASCGATMDGIVSSAGSKY